MFVTVNISFVLVNEQDIAAMFVTVNNSFVLVNEQDIAAMFVTVGMCEQAVAAYTKVHSFKSSYK